MQDRLADGLLGIVPVLIAFRRSLPTFQRARLVFQTSPLESRRAVCWLRGNTTLMNRTF